MSSNHDDDDSCKTDENDADGVNAENAQAEDVSAFFVKSLICGATEALGYEATKLFLDWFIETIKLLT